MVEAVSHRQTKGAATDMFGLQPLRYTPTLPILRIRRSPEKRPVSADSGRSRDREAPAGLTLSRRTVARRRSFSAAEGGARAVAYGGKRRFKTGAPPDPQTRPSAHAPRAAPPRVSPPQARFPPPLPTSSDRG